MLFINLTDKYQTSLIKNERIKIIQEGIKKKFKNNNFEKSYYYLTNDQFQNMDLMLKIYSLHILNFVINLTNM